MDIYIVQRYKCPLLTRENPCSRAFRRRLCILGDMEMDSRIRSILASAAIAMAFPIAAQATASIAGVASTPHLTAGMIVRDTAGAEVGTIESVSGGSAILATGQHRISLSAQSFAMNPKGPLIAMTRSELDAAAVKAEANAAAALRAQLIPGVAVKGVSGLNVIGTIRKVDDDFVVLASTKGDVRLPITAFGSGPNGVTISMSAADFETAVKRTQ